MSSVVVELSGIKKSFGPVDVLKGIDFKAYAGQVTALVGDNGAGKSTLIKGLSGVQPYDEGTVKFANEVVHIGSPLQAAEYGIEVVYQDLALCENLDIVQNMFLGHESLMTGTLNEPDMELQATKALQSLSVKTVKSVRQKVSSLSGGQQARFQVLLLELAGDTLLLLDEPTDNLDLASAESLENALNQYEGTVLTVTHDRWFCRGFTRFLIFGANGRVYEANEPVFDH